MTTTIFNRKLIVSILVVILAICALPGEGYGCCARDSVKDFNTLDATGNTSPEGIWSDGITIWVANSDDDKLYAYDMPVTVPVASAQATADFNGDGRVDFADFFEFVDAFGSSDPRFDLNGDGRVDFADFFEFVDAFGSSGGTSTTRMAFESSTPSGYTRITLRDNGRVWGIPSKYTTDSDYGTVAYMLLGRLKGCNFANVETDRQSKVYIKTQPLGRLSNFESETVCRKASSSWSSGWEGIQITHLRFFDESSPTNVSEAVYNTSTGQMELGSVSGGSGSSGDDSSGGPVTSPPPPFHIEIVFLDGFDASQKALFHQAAARWMSIITEDIPDVDFSRNPFNEWDDELKTQIRVDDRVDDLRIFVGLADIDGESKTLARAGPLVAKQSFLENIAYTKIGAIAIDTADLELISDTLLLDVILHEMAHVLGFGLFWEALNLVDGDSDRHFTGSRAIRAFNNAGGRNYDGAKVPVESDSGHWRQSVFDNELMTSKANQGDDAPLSAITIQSLADLGYRVDVSQADAYSLPDPASAKLAGAQTREWGDCILKGPIYVADENGRIVRIIEE